MLQTNLRKKSLENLELLYQVINFKKKFYPCNSAKYDDIPEGKLKLVLDGNGIEIFAKDYESMKNMLFGENVQFDKIISEIKKYEEELNIVITISKLEYV